jgi:hypothetical protein
MAKKKEIKMPAKQVEQIQDLAQKIEQAMAEINIPAEDELEVFAETVALLINHWARTGEWSPLEHISYAGYVMTTFMEKGVTEEIDKFEKWLKKKQNTN